MKTFLALLGALLFAAPAFAATPCGGDKQPACMTTYDMGLSLPALKFPWGGSTSVQVAGGAGFQAEYNLFPVSLPNATSLVPVLSLGGVMFGSVNSSTTSPYALSLGPDVCFLHAVCLAVTADLAAGGGGLPLTGLLPGRVSVANFAGVLMYNMQQLIDLL